MPNTPPLQSEINFHAQHSAPGAFMSFTLGHFGSRGGLGVQVGKPATQDVFIGVKDGDRFADATLRCLPFYEGALTDAKVGLDDAAQAFLVEQGVFKPAGKSPPMRGYRANEITRRYGWATDTWQTADLRFTIYTPFGAIPDPESPVLDSAEMKRRIMPALVAEFEVDNTKGKDVKTACFAIAFQEPGLRVIDTGLDSAIGFSMRDKLGFAAHLVGGGNSAASPIMRWSPVDAMRDADNPVHLLGNTPGVIFTVPAGQKATLRIAIGCHLPGVETTRLEGVYAYTKQFSNLTDVLNHALAIADELIEESQMLDDKLLRSGLNAEQQFVIAHSTRSYHGSSQYLYVAGQPYWIVNEGEYCMMNTLDLSVDQVFFELGQHPWVVKNLLDNFVRFYQYHDMVKDPATGNLHPGGLSFAHDQGVNNNFSALGQSSYELQNLPGCFSHMTQEQICNWSLCAASYFAKTGDKEWAQRHRPIFRACLESMQARDHFDPARRDGVMHLDSSRCGPRGHEITTYDSLDASLGQARSNLYLAVKSWATYLGLSIVLNALGETKAAQESIHAATLAGKTIAAQMRPEGFLPAVFEKESPGYHSKILPAIEGLVYPLYWSNCPHGGSGPMTWIAPTGPFAQLIESLKKHTITLLESPTRGEGGNVFPDGALKLSSTGNNSWISKMAIVQHVARRVLQLHRHEKIGPMLAHCDTTHVQWLTTGTSAYWAMSDQFLNGVALGSKYYPRGVTSTLWLM